MPLKTIYLGLGSNVRPESHLSAALDALTVLLLEMVCSPVFAGDPVGIVSAPFFNLVVRGKVDMPLSALVGRLKRIEKDNGRVAAERSRIPLDIDILLFGDEVGTVDGVVLPRPELATRSYVLWPMAELAADHIHPSLQRTFAQIWREQADKRGIRPVAFVWHGMPLTPQVLLDAASGSNPAL